MEPTNEQNEILACAQHKANLQIIAFAGTGKTSTLEMLDKALGPKPRLYLAFNRRIVEEMTKPNGEGGTRLLETTACSTFNSLGHKVWMRAISPRVVLDKKKTGNIFKELVKEKTSEERKELWELSQEIYDAVGLAKARGYIPSGCPHFNNRLTDHVTFFGSLESPLPMFAVDVVDEILTISIKQAYNGSIDFDDQIYMPALFGGSFPRYPIVMVDEAQDLSPVNHKMIEKLCRNARLVAVGDPFQSIYGFRGADMDGMARQRQTFSMTVKPLSISFRCRRAIVENARWRAPLFNWFFDGGRVDTIRHFSPLDIADESAVLCRNNAPLFRLAIKLISTGRSVRVAGSDIGPRISNLLRRLGETDLPRSAVLSAIDAWQAKRQDSPSAKDMAECLRIFADATTDLGQAIAYAKYLFDQDGTITLSTGHKAKGLEWDTVYFLDPWMVGEGEQELNLRYVIQTRAKHELFEVNSNGG